MSRGFACIALDNPKSPDNFGGVMRAAHVYGAALVVVAGRRFKDMNCNTNVLRSERHIPVVEVEDVFAALPYDCVPVAVDLIEGATPLPLYAHPRSAFYVFGAEDQTLGARIIDRCRDKIVVPTTFCMNLAATVNVVLYDRMAKRMR